MNISSFKSIMGAYSAISKLNPFSKDLKVQSIASSKVQSGKQEQGLSPLNSGVQNRQQEQDFYSLKEAPSFNVIISKIVRGTFLSDGDPDKTKDINLIVNDPTMRAKINHLIKIASKNPSEYESISDSLERIKVHPKFFSTNLRERFAEDPLLARGSTISARPKVSNFLQL